MAPFSPAEIRHQRSADVVFDFIRQVPSRAGSSEGRPYDYIYDVVETLLPYARYNERLGRGAMLELWSPANGSPRPGWTFVSEAPAAT